jgi:hypothetical protein
MPNVGFEFVPEIAFGKTEQVLSRQSPHSRVIEVSSSRMAVIDDHSAAGGGNDVGKRHLVAARRF